MAPINKEYLNYRLKTLNLSFDKFVELGYITTSLFERKYEKGLLRRDGKPGFNTSTGKVEIYSTILEKYGYDPIPVYKEPIPSPYSPSELFREYPFLLITGARSFPFYHGLGLQVPHLHKLNPDPTVEINPNAAEKLGINEGEWVLIESPERKDIVRRKAQLIQGLHDNVVCAGNIGAY